MADKKRITVYFSGMVQGVGFRFTTIRLARGARVKGYVKNLADRRVLVVAEGEESELQDFIETIKSSGLESYIKDVTMQWEEYKGEFSVFDIKY